MDLDDVRRALAFEAWADRAQLETLATLPDRAPTAEVAALRTLALHLLTGTEDWITRLEGRPSALPRGWHLPEGDELERALLVTEAALARFASALTADRLLEEAAYVDSHGRAFNNIVGDAVLHVLLHGSEHRGQIQAEVSRLGGRSLETGYIAWVRAHGQR